MAEFIVTCDVPFVVAGPNNRVHCPSGNIMSHERPVVVADLSQTEIGDLAAAVLILFTLAFVFRQVRRQFF